MPIPAKPTLTTPPTAPVRGEDRASFATKANAYVAFIGTNVTDLTAAIDWQNTVFTAIEGEAADAAQSVLDAATQVGLAEDQVDLAAAQVVLATDEADRAQTVADSVSATANFGGLWSSLTGSVSPPLSVYEAGAYWQLIVPLADVTSVTPGTDSDVWIPIAATSLDIGAITYSFADLVADGLFVRPGNSYLQSEFPELFGIVGIGSAPPIFKLTSPSVVPGANGRDVTVSTNDDFVFVVGQSNPVATLYSRSGDVLTKETGITTGESMRVAGGTKDLSLILIGVFGTPFILLYSRSGTTLTKETAPATVFSGSTTTTTGCGFNFDGTYAAIIVNQNSVNNLVLYSVSGVTLTEVDSVETLPGGSTSAGMAIHPNQNYLVCGYSNASTIELYDISAGTLSLTQTIDDTGGRLTGQRRAVQWSPDGLYLTAACDNGKVRVFSFSAGSLVEISQTYSGESGTPEVNAASINNGGDYITLAFQASPYVKVYPFSDGVIGSPGFVPSSVTTGPTACAVSSPYTGFSYVVSTTLPTFWAYKSNFPFNPATEFYVPDVPDLSSDQIGDWVPGVSAKAYVRAK